MPIATPDAKIFFHDAPYIQYEQFRLNDNFRQYLETIMTSKKVLRIKYTTAKILRKVSQCTKFYG